MHKPIIHMHRLVCVISKPKLIVSLPLLSALQEWRAQDSVATIPQLTVGMAAPLWPEEMWILKMMTSAIKVARLSDFPLSVFLLQLPSLHLLCVVAMVVYASCLGFLLWQVETLLFPSMCQPSMNKQELLVRTMPPPTHACISFLPSLLFHLFLYPGTPVSDFLMSSDFTEVMPEEVTVPQGEPFMPGSASMLKTAPFLLLLLLTTLILALFWGWLHDHIPRYLV